MIADGRKPSCPPRRDRYNRKLQKYYVVYEEADESVSEDEEGIRREEHEAL